MKNSLETPFFIQTAQIEAALSPFIEKETIPGAVVLVADKNGILAEAALGYADITHARPMRRDTLFWIASQTKPITAAAIMVLVDEAKISLDDPVAKYLPEFGSLWVQEEADEDHILLKRPERAITIRDLLCHMSGMPFRSAMEEPTIDLLTLESAIRSYVITPLKTHPGREYIYSNTGINTLGRIIEVVTKMSYEAFMDERLFKPLKMADTTFFPNTEQLSRLAKTYRPSPEGTSYEEKNIFYLHYPLDSPVRQAVPGGGLFSTIDDVLNFMKMILNKGSFEGTQILSEASIMEMTRRQTPPEVETSYGLGCEVGVDSFGHGGACGTNMKIYPEAGVIALFMIQHEGLLESGQGVYSAFETAVKAIS